ncbi:MAG TPA: hypothetical protein DCF91_11525 [Porphyromonadaceae bacterium]|nr:hypothetical protein [Porphyromonadaceae bacterium]
MYDTIELKLTKESGPGIDFLEEIPCYLTDVSEHSFSNGSISITGKLKGLTVSVSPFALSIKKGSLCKWFNGDNLGTLKRKTVKEAIDKLSDCLHLPIDKAKVTRLDIAGNLKTKFKPAVYFEHFGQMKGFQRLEQPDGLYYKKERAGLTICLYDKIREVKKKREDIPELYSKSNLLRYELRYTKGLNKAFNVPELNAGMLYSEDFYIDVINRWHNFYFDIERVNNLVINTSEMDSVKELDYMGRLALIKMAGGEQKFFKQLEISKAKGELTTKQAFRIKEAVKKAIKSNTAPDKQAETLSELDQKIKEIRRYYR